MYPCGFISCEKCTTVMRDVNDRGNYVWSIWDLWVLPLQFFCKPKTILKFKHLFKF